MLSVVDRNVVMLRMLYFYTTARTTVQHRLVAIFEAPAAVLLRIEVFRDVTLYS